MLNQVQLIGFTGAEAEIRTTQGGKKVATLRVGHQPLHQEGRRAEGLHHLAPGRDLEPGHGQLARLRALPKGAKVFVQGEIRHDRYTDKDGVERFFSKVVIATPGHELKSLDRPESNPAEEG